MTSKFLGLGKERIREQELIRSAAVLLSGAKGAGGAAAKLLFLHDAAALFYQKDRNQQADNRVRLPEAVKVIEAQADEQGHRQQAAGQGLLGVGPEAGAPQGLPVRNLTR